MSLQESYLYPRLQTLLLLKELYIIRLSLSLSSSMLQFLWFVYSLLNCKHVKEIDYGKDIGITFIKSVAEAERQRDYISILFHFTGGFTSFRLPHRSYSPQVISLRLNFFLYFLFANDLYLRLQFLCFSSLAKRPFFLFNVLFVSGINFNKCRLSLAMES